MQGETIVAVVAAVIAGLAALVALSQASSAKAQAAQAKRSADAAVEQTNLSKNQFALARLDTTQQAFNEFVRSAQNTLEIAETALRERFADPDKRAMLAPEILENHSSFVALAGTIPVDSPLAQSLRRLAKANFDFESLVMTLTHADTETWIRLKSEWADQIGMSVYSS